MKAYKITTDTGSTTIEAESVTEALMEWGEAPESVTTSETFEDWLKNVGGFGNIQEDGVIVARVAS